MDLLYAVFFGAGVTAFCYSHFARRIGYGNSQNVFVFLGFIFLIATAVFYTLLAYILHV